ncbi:hypothetical protein ES319_D13G058100v1 [Gossypium barbadense]|uniref:Uncharacterized protein n=1 Tax=Gossypium barbadense TaxID=3634 RepID=A0A5J5NHR9_GOSBA|nr:hypothetical protein ES319_D13G058100v1 [Gossypium barbadense]PPD95959.1 hypothetical protein GOBAR_DD07023 [Gossypium barbadense]
MASFNCLALAFLIALSFASIDVGGAARHLLQQPQPQSLPYFPNLPTPSRQSFPWPGALPPLPTTLPTGLPPLPSIPSVPTIPTAIPPIPFSFPPLPSFPNLPNPGALPPLPTTLPSGLPPLPSIPSIPTAVPSIPFFSSPPSRSTP